jgi:hypothetical protein
MRHQDAGDADPAAEADHQGPAAPEQPSGGTGRAMALICAAQFVLQLDFSIVNVALPTIQADLHMAAAQLQ